MKNENLDPSNLPENTIQLDLNHYGLESLTNQFFTRVKYLEKVDLSNNKIVYIEEVNIQVISHSDGIKTKNIILQEIFRNLGFLKFLDLSHNKLSVLTTNTLSGLHKLERLKINNNQIKTIELGAFDHLPSVKRIDIGDNPLICDCNIAWMLSWLDVIGTKAMCGSPPALERTLIKKLKSNDLTCDVPMIPSLGVEKYNKVVIDMKITPERPQISFEGDSLKLVCHVGLLTNDLLVRWFHNGKLLSQIAATDFIISTNLTMIDLSIHDLDHCRSNTCS